VRLVLSLPFMSVAGISNEDVGRAALRYLLARNIAQGTKDWGYQPDMRRFFVAAGRLQLGT
jgi:hypothetical protein